MRKKIIPVWCVRTEIFNWQYRVISVAYLLSSAMPDCCLFTECKALPRAELILKGLRQNIFAYLSFNSGTKLKFEPTFFTGQIFLLILSVTKTFIVNFIIVATSCNQQW